MTVHGVMSVLPLLLLIILGFFAARLPWFGPGGMHFLSKFSLNIAIPIMLFHNVLHVYSHPRDFIPLLANLPYPVAITLVGVGVGAIMAWLLRVRPPQRGVFINAVALSNTVIMGLPVASSIFGEVAIPIIMVFYASNTIIYWTLGVWLLRKDAGGGNGMGFLETLKSVFMTKPLLGFLLGVAWVCALIPMPDFLMRTMSMVGNAVTPMAMVFIGCVIRFADFRRVGHIRELAILAAYRVLAVPVVSGLFCVALPVDPMMKRVFFILANMPAMTQLPIMAKEVGSDYELASMATAVTTAISMAAVPVYVGLMGYFEFPA